MTSLGRLLSMVGLVVALTFETGDATADVRVPLQLQAQLVSRLAAFDRNFTSRAGATARVLVVSKTGDAESKRVASTIARALGGLRDVGGLPAKIEEVDFSDPTSLAARTRQDHVALVYLSIGLEGETTAISKALVGANVLTVGASPLHVTKGAVAGLDLEEGRPKIVINLACARAQSVAFKAEVLKLARLIEP